MHRLVVLSQCRDGFAELSAHQALEDFNVHRRMICLDVNVERVEVDEKFVADEAAVLQVLGMFNHVINETEGSFELGGAHRTGDFDAAQLVSCIVVDAEFDWIVDGFLAKSARFDEF